MDVVGGWHSFSDGHVTCKSLNYASSLSQNPITVRQLCVQNASCEFDGDSQSISQSINQSSPCYQHKILPTYIHTLHTYLRIYISFPTLRRYLAACQCQQPLREGHKSHHTGILASHTYSTRQSLSSHPRGVLS